ANLLVMRSIIQLAESMDMDVIAEGVEAASHVNVLRGLRCVEGQGFYLSEPILAADVARYLVGKVQQSERRYAPIDAA
ncbi:MAG: EAL domain-containing protein, partial [Pseudomonadota bacterium]